MIGGYFGAGVGDIYMSGVQCSVNDDSLWMCERDDPVNSVCTHRKDVGVKCIPG